MEIPCRSVRTHTRMLISTQYSESEREATKEIVSMGRDPSNVVARCRLWTKAFC